MPVIGKISLKRSLGKYSLEWTIDGFFSLEEKYYFSPSFNFSEMKWKLQIRPDGDAKDNTTGYVSIYLHRDKNFSAAKTIKYSFGIRKSYGVVEKLSAVLISVFDNNSTGYGRPKFIERSELLLKRREMDNPNSLTVICDFEVDNDDFDHTPRMVQFSENLEDMFDSKRFCDVTIKVQNQEFSAHKCILATRSDVFSAMFEMDMKEKNTGVVDIVDCDPGIFKDFLLYLYSGKFRSESDTILELYGIADKYRVEELKADCVIFIAKNLSLENVFEYVLFANAFHEEALQAKIVDFFIQNFSDIISSSDWDAFLNANNAVATQLLKDVAAKMNSKNLLIR